MKLKECENFWILGAFLGAVGLVSALVLSLVSSLTAPAIARADQRAKSAALRQLMRAESRDAAWHFASGRVLMQMEHFHEAHLAYREAVRQDPDNREYRAGALEAALAEKKERTLGGKVRKFIRNIFCLRLYLRQKAYL